MTIVCSGPARAAWLTWLTGWAAASGLATPARAAAPAAKPVSAAARAAAAPTVARPPASARATPAPRAPGLPWEPFATEPAAVARALRALPRPEGATREVLLEEWIARFDGDGRRELRHRRVTRLLTAAALQEGAGLNVAWEPWCQERPLVRARVIGADGAAATLDPRTIEEAGVGGDGNVYSDARRLRAPLPGLGVGAVIEQEEVTRDRVVAFPAGDSSLLVFGAPWPTAWTRLVLDAPATLPRHVVTRRLPGLVRTREEHGGRVVERFEQGPLAAFVEPAEGTPFADRVPPYVAYATGRSWHEVAKGYAAVVEQQLAHADRGALEKLAREALGGVRDRQGVAARLLALVRRRVRYTGVEFGDAAITPRPPGETLARAYGDCKDQALLLVALLRAAGQPAEVALLRAGSDLVDAELPGLGLFNHAIVYLPGPAPLWLDPTSPFARAGELPRGDQGKLALVARADTAAPLRTPLSGSADNRAVVTRELFLSESGAARAVETSEYFGSHERGVREHLSRLDADKLKELATNDAIRAFNASEVARVEHGEVGDLDTRLRVRVEVPSAPRGWTDDGEAVVAIFPTHLVEELPEGLYKGNDKRSVDYEIEQPSTFEWRYRVTPPPGFDAAPQPADGAIALGPLRITTAFKREHDLVLATLRLETPAPRLGPAAVTALRAAYRELSERAPIFIRFHQRAWVHAQNGRLREAVAAHRELMALHPKEARHHCQLALLLANAGLGEAGRAEALRAVALEPDSAYAHLVLGMLYERDQLGVAFGRGFDRARAEAELRRAQALAPARADLRRELAVLLEYDGAGARYGARAHLDEAIAAYRAIPDATDDKDLNENILFPLAWAGRWKELVETARALPASTARDQQLLVGVAALSGPAAALAEAERLGADGRQATLAHAAETLFRLRRYPDAAALYDAVGNDAAKLMRRLRRFDPAALPAREPATVAKRVLLALVRAAAGDEVTALQSLEPLVTPSARPRFLRDAATEVAVIARELGRANFPIEVALDVIFSFGNFDVDGDDQSGYRVRVGMPSDFGGGNSSFLVVRDGASYRVLDLGAEVAPLGERALALVDAGQLAAARRWLDWAAEREPRAAETLLVKAPFGLLWCRFSDRSPVMLRAAATALLAADAEHAALAVPRLRALRGTPGVPDEPVDLALARAAQLLGRGDDLMAALDAAVARNPEADELGGLRVLMLADLGRRAELNRAVAERHKQGGEDRAALVGQWMLAESDGRWAEGRRLLDRLVARDANDELAFNQRAWLGLVDGGLTPAALEDARRAAALGKRENRLTLHTLAALEAELGKPADARAALVDLKALRGGVVDPVDYFVLGRLAERLGLPEVAADYYRRVLPAPAARQPAFTTYALAQRRLHALPAR